MISRISNKPSWLEAPYRILTPYVEWPENFADTEMPCLFIVREDTPSVLRKLAAAYDCYWCNDSNKCLKIKDRQVVGVADEFDGMSEQSIQLHQEEGKVLWTLIQRGDLPADITKWGDSFHKVHQAADAAYPGWRDYDDDENYDDDDG